MLRLDSSERAWLEKLAHSWGVKLIFREYLGADMFARVTITSDGEAWVEMLQSFDPEDYYRRWGNRDISPGELFRFLLLHEIAHLKLGHDRESIPKDIRTKEDWQKLILEREAKADQWAKRRLRDPWPREDEKGVYLIGCSGWSYESWKDVYYPSSLKQSEWLSYYAKDFPTVEINMSFYRLPFENIVRSWARKVPPCFRFAAKGSRRITHYQRLKDCEGEIRTFFERFALLPQLSCVLWQLPPSIYFDPELLEGFCYALPAHLRQAIEFRHVSWWEKVDETAKILSKYKIAFVGVSRKGFPDQVPVTAEFSYIRFHGLGKNPYQWDYSAEELKPWARRMGELLKKGIDVYAYFNNDFGALAIKNSKVLLNMLNQSSRERRSAF